MISFLSFLGSSGLALAQGEVRGRVYPAPGEASLPQDITVTLEFPMETFEDTVVVDQKGEFRFNFSAGEFVDAYVTLKCPGYQTKRIHFNSFDRFPRYLTVTLGPRLPSNDQPRSENPAVVGTDELKAPQETLRHLSQAARLMSENKPEEALDQIQEAEDLSPNFVEVHASRGMVLMKLNRLKEAEESLKKAIELDENHFASQKNLGFLYLATRRESEALEPLQKAVEINSSDSSALGFLGEAYYQNGNYKEAVKPLQKALEINPEFFRASYRLGYVFVELKRYPEALDAFRKFLATNKGMNENNVRNIVKQLEAALG